MALGPEETPHVPNRSSDMLVTAVVRAALAWSRRRSHPCAWREIARMGGVVQYVLGPGNGPDGPMQLIDALRKPLSDLAPGVLDGEPMADVVLLSGDDVALEVYEWGREYTHALFDDSSDEACAWLPSWSWQRDEQIEREVFSRMRSGSEAEYSATRLFLTSFPAGHEHGLARTRRAMGALAVARFDPVPSEQSSGGWWWACPLCRWPMRVTLGRVRCDIRQHQADYDLRSADARHPEVANARLRAHCPGPLSASPRPAPAPCLVTTTELLLQHLSLDQAPHTSTTVSSWPTPPPAPRTRIAPRHRSPRRLRVGSPH